MEIDGVWKFIQTDVNVLLPENGRRVERRVEYHHDEW